MTDDQILDKIGLTDGEVRDIQARFSQLASSLDPAQRHTLEQNPRTAAAAAQTLGPDVTAERLMEFIRARAPHDAAAVLVFNGLGRKAGAR